MKNCPACGLESQDTALFCQSCGIALPASAPHPPSAFAPDAAAAPPVPASPPAETVSPWAVVPPEGIPSAVAQTAPPQATPVSEQNPQWIAPELPSKKKNLPRILGICAAAGVLVGVFVTAIYFLNPNPETKASAAMKKTETAIETQLKYISKAMGSDVLSDVAENPSLTEIYMDISKSVPELPSGQWLRIKAYSDPVNTLSNFQITNSFGIEGDIFSDSESLTVDAPDFLSSPVSFSYQLLQQNLSDGSLLDSYLPGYQTQPSQDDWYDQDWSEDDWNWDDELALDTVVANRVSANATSALPMMSSSSQSVSDILSSLLAGGTPSDIDFEPYKQKFEAAKDNLKAAAVYAPVEKEKYPGFSGELEKILITYPDAAADTYLDDCLDILWDILDDISPELSSSIKSEIPAITVSGFSETIYIQSGYACVYDLHLTLTAENEPLALQLTMQTSDGKTPLADWSISLKADSRWSTMELGLDGNGNYSEENGLDYTVNLSYNDGSTYSSTETMTLEVQCNPNTAGNNLKLSLKSGSDFNIRLTGALQVDETSVALSLSSLNATIYGETTDLPLDVQLRYETTDGYQGKPIPSGTKDGFSLTPDELEAISLKLQEKVWELMGLSYDDSTITLD